MHESVALWALARIDHEMITGRDVLEAGAYDVNGSLRGSVMSLQPRTYFGADIRGGPGVDVICDAAGLPPQSCDVVISTEMLEHAEHWTAALEGMHNALRPGGVLLLTTRGPGFSRHDHPGDFWRFTCPIISYALVATLHMELLWLQPDPDHPGVFALAKRFTSQDSNATRWPDAYPVT